MEQAETPDLRGRTVLVTGGNSGIGLGMAVGLARAGADVCIWGRSPERNAAALEVLGAAGTRVAVSRRDVSQETDVQEGMEELIERFGRLDACFANAAAGPSGGRFVETGLEEWRAVLGVDLDGVFLTLREAARRMIAQGSGGSLVAVSSLTGPRFGAVGRAAYAAAKAGVVGLVRVLAVELGRHEIRVNALLPGFVESAMFRPDVMDEAVSEPIRRRMPLRRWGRPEDLAAVAVYLAGPGSRFHTGDCLHLDGGYSIA